MADSLAVRARQADHADQPTLAAGAIGLAGQLFQSITHMAPAAGVEAPAAYTTN